MTYFRCCEIRCWYCLIYGLLDEENKARIFSKAHYIIMLQYSLLYLLLIDSNITGLRKIFDTPRTIYHANTRMTSRNSGIKYNNVILWISTNYYYWFLDRNSFF